MTDDFTQGFTNPGHQVTRATFCTVVPNICGSKVQNLLHTTLLAPEIRGRLMDIWKNLCTPDFADWCRRTFKRSGRT